MVLDGAIATAADEDEFITASCNSLFHGVLDEGFIHHRHHFLGDGLGSWQEASAQPRHRKNRFANFWHQYLRLQSEQNESSLSRKNYRSMTSKAAHIASTADLVATDCSGITLTYP
jgi:hypothetical protein